MIDRKLSELVGVYDDAIPLEICEKTIKYFEECDKLEFTSKGSSGLSGNVNTKVKQSTDLQLLWEHGSSNPFFTPTHDPKTFREIHNALIEAMILHCRKYTVELLEMVGSNHNPFFQHEMQLTSLQVQRYRKDEAGYPALHVESEGPTVLTRFLAPLIYLNDIEVEGETEIPLAGMKVKPKAGRILIIPAGIPFWHRGLKSPEKDKYVVTSWVEYVVGNKLISNMEKQIQILKKQADMPNMHINPSLLFY
jgi:hypothetical protein